MEKEMEKEEDALNLTVIQRMLIELIKTTKINGYTIEINSVEGIEIRLW